MVGGGDERISSLSCSVFFAPAKALLPKNQKKYSLIKNCIKPFRDLLVKSEFHQPNSPEIQNYFNYSLNFLLPAISKCSKQNIKRL